MKNKIPEFVWVIPALIVYAALAHHLNFIQDDAYISYRYVANFLNGNGLVFNIGERIEGFTNFGWVVYLIMWGALGVSYILMSQITGFLFGGGIIVLTWIISRRVLEEMGTLVVLLPVYLVAANQSLAYWAPAGLETATFAFFALLSLYLYMRRSRMLILSMTLAVWLRPEGALVVGLLILIEALTERRIPRFTLYCAAGAFVLSLPMVIFKIAYYGGILPNPFYAKTGFSMEQIANGLEYAGRFMSHYGFYGIGFLVPLLAFKRLSKDARIVWMFAVLFTLYLILVGGDVLKVHRFFLPVFGPAAVLIGLSIGLAVAKMKRKTGLMVTFVVALPLLALTFTLPRSYVSYYNMAERAFVAKMNDKAHCLLDADSTAFSVAIPTIGRFGYELLGHDVIDMVGLTDSTIARHPQDPIPGMVTTWKEGRYNTPYLLRRSPDYILFSTGLKPSAPAEKALLLYPQFLHSYRWRPWLSAQVSPNRRRTLYITYKRVRPVEGEIKPTYPLAYVEDYKLGIETGMRRDYKGALQYYGKALQESPQPYNVDLLYQIAESQKNMGQIGAAVNVLNMILKQDSLVWAAHRDLYQVARLTGDSTAAQLHRKWLISLAPWEYPNVEANTLAMIRANRKQE